MKPVAVLKSRPVAVRKQSGPQLQYDMQGRPSFVFGAGGGGRGGGGRSKRERLLGAAGGLVGVLGGALTPTRSLGGLLGGMYAGGAQGSAVAGGLGRRLTGRRRQAELDARAELRDAEAKRRGQERVQLREDYRGAKGPSRFKTFRETGQFKTGKHRDAEMREFLEGKRDRMEGETDASYAQAGPRGGLRYDTRERQLQMAQYEKDNAAYEAAQRKHILREAAKLGVTPDLTSIQSLPIPPRTVGPMDDVNQQNLARFAAIAGAEDAVTTPAEPGTGDAMVANGGAAFGHPQPEGNIEGNLLATEQVASEHGDANRTPTLRDFTSPNAPESPPPLTPEQRQNVAAQAKPVSLEDFMSGGTIDG